MDRVDYTELGAHPDEGDGNTLNGEPFTGVAESRHPNGELGSEWTYRGGWLWGPLRRWWEDGRLAESSFIVRGAIHGAFRVWYENGQKSEVTIHHFGITIRTKCWDEDGEVIEDFTLPSGDEQWARVRELETEFAQALADEPLPPEFAAVAENEWDDPAPRCEGGSP